MNIQNSDVMVARAVIIPGESIPVCVMNPTNQPVTLYRGTRIAQLAVMLHALLQLLLLFWPLHWVANLTKI